MTAWSSDEGTSANSVQMFPPGSNQEKIVVGPKSLSMTGSIKGLISELSVIATVSGWRWR